MRKRLEFLASLIDEDSYVYDVGCDHAYLDIDLTKKKNCFCTAIDLRKSALEIAKKNIQKSHLEGKITLLCHDGLKNLCLVNHAKVVLAGMGAHTIMEIVSSADLKHIDQFIIQSNNDWSYLRREMLKKGYFIQNEQVLFDKKWYVILVFEKGWRKYRKWEYEFGPILIKENHVFYFRHLYDQYDQIYQKLPHYHWYKRLCLKKKMKFLKKQTG